MRPGFAPHHPRMRAHFGAFGHFGPGFRGHFVHPFGRFGRVHVSGFYGGFPGFLPAPVVLPAGVGYAPPQPTIIVIQLPPPQPRAAYVRTRPAPAAVSQSPPEQAPPGNPQTLLVLKNHSMYAVTDYWVEGDRLHYVFSYGTRKSVPLDQLDLEFTRKLNQERGVQFALPM